MLTYAAHFANSTPSQILVLADSINGLKQNMSTERKKNNETI